MLPPLDSPPRAARFIVTLYGDVVEPRGGALWMGNMIEICGLVGLSESLVRTAVSRLVTAGQLMGERAGRRSYYRLTDAARAEYTTAGRLFYGPSQPAQGWRWVLRPAGALPSPYAAVGRDAWLGPNWGATPTSGVRFDARACDSAELGQMALDLWPLAEVAEAYRDFAATWQTATAELGAEAIAGRLRLVDAFRAVVLRDPRLPVAALPQDWPEPHARAAFARAYLALTPAAERWIGDQCESLDGPLPVQTEASGARVAAMTSVLDTFAAS